MRRYQLLIDGTWCDPTSGEWFVAEDENIATLRDWFVAEFAETSG